MNTGFCALRTHSLKFAMIFFFIICVSFPFQNKENRKCLLPSTNVSALCLYFDVVSAILQALHIRALLSRSSGKMKFDSSLWYVKAGLLHFCGDHVRVFYLFCKLHILYPGSRGPFSKYLRWNKPLLRLILTEIRLILHILRKSNSLIALLFIQNNS